MLDKKQNAKFKSVVFSVRRFINASRKTQQTLKKRITLKTEDLNM